MNFLRFGTLVVSGLMISLLSFANDDCSDAVLDEDSQVILNNFSTAPLEVLRLPKKRITELSLIENFNPYKRFTKSADLTTESLLVIDHSNELELTIKGKSFRTGESGDDYTEVLALDFTKGIQRYLVNLNYGFGEEIYQILVNVAVKAQTAFAWIRSREESGWGEWKELPPLVDSPAQLLMGEFEVHSQSLNVEFRLRSPDNEPRLTTSIYSKRLGDTKYLSIPLTLLAARHIQNANLKELDGQEFRSEETGESIRFEVSGSQFGGRTTLRAYMTDDEGGEYEVESITVHRRARYYR